MAGGLVRTALNGVKASGFNAGDAINIAFAASDYNTARQEGNSKAVSVAKAAGSFAWGEFFYGGMNRAIGGAVAKIGIKGVAAGALTMGATIGVTALMTGGQVMSVMSEHTTKTMNNAYAQRGRLGSGHFEMSEAGYTMRQRSLNAIRSNGLNTQSVLGNEARTYFRGSY